MSLKIEVQLPKEALNVLIQSLTDRVITLKNEVRDLNDQLSRCRRALSESRKKSDINMKAIEHEIRTAKLIKPIFPEHISFDVRDQGLNMYSTRFDKPYESRIISMTAGLDMSPFWRIGDSRKIKQKEREAIADEFARIFATEIRKAVIDHLEGKDKPTK